MKNIVTSICLVFITLFSSCKKDSNANLITTANVNSSVTAGTWRITYYWDTDHEETSNFSGYNFTFATSGVLTATNGSSPTTGNWSTSSENNTVKLIINFLTLANFVSISTDWEVIERGETIIKLRHISGGGGGTDFLTFEKN